MPHITYIAHDGASQTLVNGWVQQDVAQEILASAGQDLAALSAAVADGQARNAPVRRLETSRPGASDGAREPSLVRVVGGGLPGGLHVRLALRAPEADAASIARRTSVNSFPWLGPRQGAWLLPASRSEICAAT